VILLALTNYVLVQAEADLNDELSAWLQEAHDIVGLQSDLRSSGRLATGSVTGVPPLRQPARPLASPQPAGGARAPSSAGQQTEGGAGRIDGERTDRRRPLPRLS
jgi:hypothetical protein